MLVALYEGGDGALRWVRRVGGKEDQAGRGVATWVRTRAIALAMLLCRARMLRKS